MTVAGCVSGRTQHEIERQRQVIIQFCEKNGLNVSAWLVNRDWLHLRDVVAEGLVQVIVVARTDHLPFMYEDERDRLFKALEDKGATLRSVEEGDVKKF